MIKGSIQEEDITIINIYAPDHRCTSIQRQIPTTIKGEINSNTITVGDFNAPVSAMDRSSRENLIRKHKL